MYSSRFFKNKHKLHFFLIVSFSLSISSCKKFVEVDPPRTELVKETVFSGDATATAAVVDLYYQTYLRGGGIFSGTSASYDYLGAILSDEQLNYISFSTPETNGMYKQFADNTLLGTNEFVFKSWSELYKQVYRANSVIEGLAASTGISENLKKQLEGEARFMRAFSYFYLVNLWGDVPLTLTTDYKINNTVVRASKASVFQQIVIDLQIAQSLLSNDYSYSDNLRVRANKGVATALLARTYLYTEDWVKAEAEATSLINNTAMYGLASNLAQAFRTNSKEAIFQFWSKQFPAAPRATFNVSASGPSYGAIRPEYALSFEPGDQRWAVWGKSRIVNNVTYYFSLRYLDFTSPPLDYYSVLRLAEQYLIRAEARAKQGKIVGVNSAETDVNAIRARAGLSPTTATTQQAMLAAIEKERKVEFFNDWGHRWMDLKRTGRVDAVLSSIKPQWKPYQALFPIPQKEITNNPALVQNPGY